MIDILDAAVLLLCWKENHHNIILAFCMYIHQQFIEPVKLVAG